MCKVKTGADVETVAELQSLVTSVILRQTQPFSKRTIQDEVISKLEGSEFWLNEEKQSEVFNICERTIKFMVLSSSIKSNGMTDGRYRLSMSFPSYCPTVAN